MNNGGPLPARDRVDEVMTTIIKTLAKIFVSMLCIAALIPVVGVNNLWLAVFIGSIVGLLATEKLFGLLPEWLRP